MGKTEALEKLFDELKAYHEFDIFCKDGIVDESEYGNGMPKIVYLLKDANVEKADEADICKNLIDTINGINNFGKMWKVICMWSRIAENPDCRFTDCCDDKFDVDDSIREYLKKIAVVNLSKEHGKGINDQDELSVKLAKSVERYYHFTKREIDIIDPDIVICCGTYHYVLGSYNVKDKVLPSGARCFEADGKLFVEMYHPASYISYPALFAYFKEVYLDLK